MRVPADGSRGTQPSEAEASAELLIRVAGLVSRHAPADAIGRRADAIGLGASPIVDNPGA